MNLGEVVKKMSITEVVFNDGTIELRDTTLNQLSTIVLGRCDIKSDEGIKELHYTSSFDGNQSIVEVRSNDIRDGSTHIVIMNSPSPEILLKKLEAGADSDKPQYKFLRERVEYWRELYSTGKILELNFGISSCSRHAPGYQLEERIMGIPLIGVLQNISDFEIQYLDPKDCEPRRFNLSNYSDVRGDKYTHLPAVSFPLAKEFTLDHEIYLVWVDQRKEWVAFNHSEWLGSCNYPDELESGPYALDDICKTKLLEAYKVPPDNVELADAHTFSPSRLEEMANEKAIGSSEEGLTLYLYDHESVDGCDRYLDITVTLSKEEAHKQSEIILESIMLSKDEIKKLMGIDRAVIMKNLFSKFGITDLSSRPGQPKGPSYWVGEDVYKALDAGILPSKNTK